jgi:hypothetical protein
MRVTRLLLSLAVVVMLVGFTHAGQEKKDAPKHETTAPAKAPEHKHTKKAMKAKMVHAKKNEIKEEKKEAPPVK